nr:hypothetical protein [Tanacetum cinerariifolium]
PTINSELLPTQGVMQRCMMDGSLLNLFREELPVMLSLQEKKREKDLQYFEDKVLLIKAKERGEVLDAEAEAFLADVECDEPYDEPLAITTTTAFNVDHENAYDSDETPNESPSEFEALLGLQAELHGYVLANREQLLEISNLNAELARCKLEIKDLDHNKVKHDLDQAIVDRNRRNEELRKET